MNQLPVNLIIKSRFMFSPNNSISSLNFYLSVLALWKRTPFRTPSISSFSYSVTLVGCEIHLNQVSAIPKAALI